MMGPETAEARVSEVFIECDDSAFMLLRPSVQELIRFPCKPQLIDMIYLLIRLPPAQPFGNENGDILIQEYSQASFSHGRPVLRQ